MEQESIYPEVIAERYELKELLSHGGMSSVFRCVDRMLNVDCAIKLLSLEEILSKKGRERFEQECQMLLHFDHPNIIHNLDYGIFEDIPYLVMELCVDGKGRPFTLRQLQSQTPDNKLPWEQLKYIWAQTLKGIALFHQHGLVHRDIKPENILLQRLKDGTLIPKLIDFGLVAVTSDEMMRNRMQLSTPVEQQPIDSSIINGTLNYMSPEQLEGKPVDASSDVYSLGIMVFSLLTGLRHPSLDPDALKELDLPDWLSNTLEKCYHEDPENRFREASDVLLELPNDLLETSAKEDDLDRNAPTKHQLPVSAKTILLADPVDGRFQVLDEVNKIPGMFEFTCRDLSCGKMMNIRIMPIQRETPDTITEAFLRQCQKLKTVEHPGIISITDCGIDTNLNVAFVVTEQLPIEDERPNTLAELIETKEDGHLDAVESTRLFAPIMTALSTLHRHGITHGNLAPENIRLKHLEDGSISPILDGCLNMQVHTDEGRRHVPEFSGRKTVIADPEIEVFCGVYDYMAPEQFTGAVASLQTDVYSLGLLLYRITTGFSRQSYQFPCEVNNALPVWVDDVCRYALEELPENRIKSAILLEALVPAKLRNAVAVNFVDDGDATEKDLLLETDSKDHDSNIAGLTAIEMRNRETAFRTVAEVSQTSKLVPHLYEQAPAEVDFETPPDNEEVPRTRPTSPKDSDDVVSTLSISVDKDDLRRSSYDDEPEDDQAFDEEDQEAYDDEDYEQYEESEDDGHDLESDYYEDDASDGEEDEVEYDHAADSDTQEKSPGRKSFGYDIPVEVPPKPKRLVLKSSPKIDTQPGQYTSQPAYQSSQHSSQPAYQSSQHVRPPVQPLSATPHTTDLVPFNAPNMPPKRLVRRNRSHHRLRRKLRRYMKRLPLVIISLGVAASCVICFLILDYFEIINVFPETASAPSTYSVYMTRARKNLELKRFAAAEHNARRAAKSPGLSLPEHTAAARLAMAIENAKSAYAQALRDGNGTTTQPALMVTPKSTGSTSPEHPKSPSQSERIIDHLSLLLKPIPAGSFVMGSADKNAISWGPQHKVIISKHFWVSQCEITQKQFMAVMGLNPSAAKSGQNPVESVTWTEAMEFCKNLTASEHQKNRLPNNYVYRLPTEAEWEYACRAGKTTDYFFGNNPANLKNFSWTRQSVSTDTPQPQEVGKKRPNAWGLMDMQGNVREWCLDAVSLTPSGPDTSMFLEGIIDPLGRNGPYRVIRGGSIKSTDREALIVARNAVSPNITSFELGFRIVLAPEATQK